MNLASNILISYGPLPNGVGGGNGLHCTPRFEASPAVSATPGRMIPSTMVYGCNDPVTRRDICIAANQYADYLGWMSSHR